jgi:hypothetical protein
MFEAHGWATIRSTTSDAEEERLGELAGVLEAKIRELNSITNVVVRLEIDLNGSDALTVVAFKNHRKDQLIELFQWLAVHRRGSYGLLYVWDDEDRRDVENVFRVWKLTRGTLAECADPFLSPPVPVIEDAYDRDDSQS